MLHASSLSPHRVSSTRRLPALVAVAATLLLTGCAGGVSVPVAPHATDPVCANIVLAMPDQLGSFARIKTASQATAAWGDTPQQAITVRCGVEIQGPTEEHCTTVTDVSGREVDWITIQDAETGVWTMTTYGRSPAVEVTIPPGMSTSPAVELTTAVSLAPATRFCSGLPPESQETH